ncbi:NAD(P)-dependent alcohol dehydrogenase [Rhodococcus sp. UNC363MFTsu5.1]|uniref:NAD(P)-dependent alcohol dehydrogenase n=1 Tax=Rhodococcus sp. UNC363MFTsu5.1 TaxID=1449069 RepID=UPI000484D17B|nr:NAD(P)-dependent alcohol dehydrogenase [Rhodococcus sp. UNC363MFTsu5.1]
MKAIVHTRFGGPEVLRLVQVRKPTPGDREVLVRVHATTVTTAECKMRRGEPRWGRVILGLRRPRRKLRTLGTELAGEIEAVGRDVQRFRPGDRVFGFTGFDIGAYAEYKCLPDTASLALKPVNTTYEQAAAAVDGATTALFFLRDKAKVRPGQRVLVNGASGSIGTYAVQLAKSMGAEVTGVCGPHNLEMVKSLGADEVIDYSGEDFTDAVGAYDIVFDTVGRNSFARCKGSLTENGCYVTTSGLNNVLLSLWTSLRGGRKVVTGMSVRKNETLAHVKELIEADQLRIVIDRCYPLDQIVEAHRYVDTGHKRGNVVISVEPSAAR